VVGVVPGFWVPRGCRKVPGYRARGVVTGFWVPGGLGARGFPGTPRRAVRRGPGFWGDPGFPGRSRDRPSGGLVVGVPGLGHMGGAWGSSQIVHLWDLLDKAISKFPPYLRVCWNVSVASVSPIKPYPKKPKIDEYEA
jgi:hypothetical protein